MAGQLLFFDVGIEGRARCQKGDSEMKKPIAQRFLACLALLVLLILGHLGCGGSGGKSPTSPGGINPMPTPMPGPAPTPTPY
jgi:hypothetical protein